MKILSVLLPHPAIRWGVLMLVLGLLVAIFNPIVFINSHERGLKLTMGKVDKAVLAPGMHGKIPIFQSIETVTMRPIEVTDVIHDNSEGAVTKDNQTIGASMTFFYTYNQDELVVMWNEYGKEKIETLIASAIKESFKSVAGNYTIFDIPMNQDEIKNKVLKESRGKLLKYPITITELRITNYDWSDEFDNQIKATMQKAQQVKQKEQELKMAEIETQKAVKKAEADKQSIALMAEAKVLEGEGIRKYNESIRATKDIEIALRELEIKLIQAKAWNGQYVSTNNYTPIPWEHGKLQGQ